MEGVTFDYIKTRIKSITLSIYYGYNIQQLPLTISKAEIFALNKLYLNKDSIISRPEQVVVLFLTAMIILTKFVLFWRILLSSLKWTVMLFVTGKQTGSLPSRLVT